MRERVTLWLPETLAVAGAMACIDEDGEINVRRGLVSPADSAADANVGDDDDGADEADADDVAAAGYGLPYSLVESLTTHRTAIAAIAASRFSRSWLH